MALTMVPGTGPPLTESQKLGCDFAGGLLLSPAPLDPFEIRARDPLQWLGKAMELPEHESSYWRRWGRIGGPWPLNYEFSSGGLGWHVPKVTQ